MEADFEITIILARLALLEAKIEKQSLTLSKESTSEVRTLRTRKAKYLKDLQKLMRKQHTND